MAWLVTPTEREELKALLPDFLTNKLGIVSLNRSFRCPNPDHEDSTPSAYYYADSQIVHCFGCQKTWDIFSLAGMVYGISDFLEQARQVAQDLGYCLSGGSDRDRDVLQSTTSYSVSYNKLPYPYPKETDFCIDLDICFEMYEAMFTLEGNAARDYLHARGIGDESIVKYGLGFTVNPTKLIPEFAIYEPEATGFLMIPFYGEDPSSANHYIARPVGSSSVTHKEWRPKEVAPTLWHEWLLYSQAPILYVAEGVLDAISLETLLQKPCLALCGTGNVSRLCGILYHMPPSQRPAKIMIATDQDKAGQMAAKRISECLNLIGVPHALMPPYPNGEKDANEWLMAEHGKSWSYKVETLGENLTPLHIARSI